MSSTPAPSISVILPHYNRSDRIAVALQSVLKQTVPVSEILIVDDASSPEHRAGLKKYENIAKIIGLETNAGPAGARNAGIKAATSEYLAFLDDDDEWFPERLEVQLNEIAMHPGIAAVTSGVLIQYGDGAERVETGHSPETMTVEATLEGTPALIQTFLVRADVMRAIGGFDSRFRQFEDQECCVRLTAGGYTVRHIRKPLVKLYRGGADHLTNQWWPHTRGQLAVAQKHWALYNRVLGGREARRTVSRYVRRAGLRKGRILGRVVYAIGCVMGGDMRPALTLLTTGKMLDVPFDRARYC